jgi:hypothetical protein
MLRYASLLIIYLLVPLLSSAESITGEIIDGSANMGLEHVHIVNVHSKATAETDDKGRFRIFADKGQLLEFRKMGYKTLRIRLPQGSFPPYFKLVMQKGPVELPSFELVDHTKDYKKDSLRYREIYKHALEFPELTGLDVIRHPFSALSKKNRQIWAFQKEYALFEQQKFIDYAFNEKVVTNLTGLKGDSLNTYLRVYRPGYEQLRSMNDYTFYSYIKETVRTYRTGRTYRPTIRRSSN